VARKELKQAIQSLSASDEDERGAGSFNIVLYSTQPEVYKAGAMVVATLKNKEKAIEWIEEKVKASGQTNLYDSIEQAFNIISATKEGKNLEKGADTIFVMTDGFPNRGKFFDTDLILHETKTMNQTRKITIHTIGVGEGHNRMFLMQLAAQNDGQYLAR
jgi:Mg-chelatase subunit ChlD